MRMRSTTEKKNSTDTFIRSGHFFRASRKLRQSSTKLPYSTHRKPSSKLQSLQSQHQKPITTKYQHQTKPSYYFTYKQSISLLPNTNKNSLRQLLQRRSQDTKITSAKQYQQMKLNKMNIIKKQKRNIDANTYQKQINVFANLYQLLCNVLTSMKNEGDDKQQRAVSEYGQFINQYNLQFMDEFIQDECDRIKKLVTISRIHQYLSIAYIFLQIAQQRISSNQSYLINFIQFSLSNLIFVAKLYVFLQKKPQFIQYQFEKQMNQFQQLAYGLVLTNIDDILFRIQHNNQIITLMHKKLGQYNQKFQQYIIIFLKKAQRNKYSSCICSHHIFQYLSMYIHQTNLIGISPPLDVSPSPYLSNPQHDYTLVFQPLGIMINKKRILRPYLLPFFDWASRYFDLVLWTWEMPKEVQDVVELFEPFIFSKLYRYHCVISNKVYTKNLNRLGRNLKKTVIIDYDERIFADTPTNGFVARWKNNSKDNGLLIIAQMLQEMLAKQTSVQDMLNFYAEQAESIRGAEIQHKTLL